jgi:hypothetical protein
MVGLGAGIGLPDRVDHPREPPADSPRSAEQCPVPARWFCFVCIRNSFQNEKSAFSSRWSKWWLRQQSGKRDFFSVSSGFLMLGGRLCQGGCLHACACWRAFDRRLLSCMLCELRRERRVVGTPAVWAQPLHHWPKCPSGQGSHAEHDRRAVAESVVGDLEVTAPQGTLGSARCRAAGSNPSTTLQSISIGGERAKCQSSSRKRRA